MSEIQFYHKGWVDGTRAAAYFGGVTAEVFVPDSTPRRSKAKSSTQWIRAIGRLEKKLKRVAQELNERVNSVVSYELEVDPFAQLPEPGVRFCARGSATLLEPIWGKTLPQGESFKPAPQKLLPAMRGA